MSKILGICSGTEIGYVYSDTSKALYTFEGRQFRFHEFKNHTKAAFKTYVLVKHILTCFMNFASLEKCDHCDYF